MRHFVTLTAIDDTTTELTVNEFSYPNTQLLEVSRAGIEQVLDKIAAALAAS